MFKSPKSMICQHSKWPPCVLRCLQLGKLQSHFCHVSDNYDVNTQSKLPPEIPVHRSHFLLDFDILCFDRAWFCACSIARNCITEYLCLETASSAIHYMLSLTSPNPDPNYSIYIMYTLHYMIKKVNGKKGISELGFYFSLFHFFRHKRSLTSSQYTMYAPWSHLLWFQ